MVIPGLFACLLITVFQGKEQAMLPLYAVGVFLSFTLSQSGIVVHWMRELKAAVAEKRIREEERGMVQVGSDFQSDAVADPGKLSSESPRSSGTVRHPGSCRQSSTQPGR